MAMPKGVVVGGGAPQPTCRKGRSISMKLGTGSLMMDDSASVSLSDTHVYNPAICVLHVC